MSKARHLAEWWGVVKIKMDCCKTKEEKGCCKDLEKHPEKFSDNMKGGAKMETQKIVLWVIIGILLLAVIYTIFFQGSAGSASSSLSPTAGQAASAYSGMVGGC